MPATHLAQFRLADRVFSGQDWGGADLRGMSLRRAVFSSCNLTGVNFEGADLFEARFNDCQFSDANPELAASLHGTTLLVEGLAEDQRARCAARGAIVTDNDNEPGAS